MISERRREYLRKYLKKWRSEHKEDMRKRRSDHPEYRARQMKRRSERREEYNASHRKYRAENLNTHGVPKSRIRVMSGKILDSCHAKLSGYEIHHCFGYEDPNRFIYVPKSLHIQIHQLLRDKKIPADSDHWFAIRDLVNSCQEYTYIRA